MNNSVTYLIHILSLEVSVSGVFNKSQSLFYNFTLAGFHSFDICATGIDTMRSTSAWIRPLRSVSYIQ